MYYDNLIVANEKPLCLSEQWDPINGELLGAGKGVYANAPNSIAALSRSFGHMQWAEVDYASDGAVGFAGVMLRINGNASGYFYIASWGNRMFGRFEEGRMQLLAEGPNNGEFHGTLAMFAVQNVIVCLHNGEVDKTLMPYRNFPGPTPKEGGVFLDDMYETGSIGIVSRHPVKGVTMTKFRGSSDSPMLHTAPTLWDRLKRFIKRK